MIIPTRMQPISVAAATVKVSLFILFLGSLALGPPECTFWLRFRPLRQPIASLPPLCLSQRLIRSIHPSTEAGRRSEERESALSGRNLLGYGRGRRTHSRSSKNACGEQKPISPSHIYTETLAAADAVNSDSLFPSYSFSLVCRRSGIHTT